MGFENEQTVTHVDSDSTRLITNPKRWKHLNEKQLAFLVCHLQFHKRATLRTQWMLRVCVCLALWVLVLITWPATAAEYPVQVLAATIITTVANFIGFHWQSERHSQFRNVSLAKPPPKNTTLHVLQRYKEDTVLLQKALQYLQTTTAARALTGVETQAKKAQ
jgi:hypothetical protein